MRVLKKITFYIGLLILTGATLTLPGWNPYPMSVGESIAWWIIFGGGIVVIWGYVLTRAVAKLFGLVPRDK